jgi:perosamine synthetase
MSNLAVLGGEKAVTLDYNKLGKRPLVNEKGLNDAVALMKKGAISQSPTVQEFEKRFANFVGAKYSVATNNGTAALDSALFAVGVEPGEEVIVPSYTFWATVVPIIAEHAVPVFCDVDPETFCADPADIERKITPKTKAIMIVHVWGNPANMDAIMKIAKKHHLGVVEDCSHAHGAKYRGTNVGLIGDVGCYSMQASKLLPAGEGGILVTNSRENYERALALGQYDRLAGLPDDSEYKRYMLTGMGHKYRPHPVAIALANAQLDDLDARNAIRNGNARMLEKLIADIPFLRPQKIYDGAEREFAYHYMYFDSGKFGGIRTITLLKALSAEGVVCGYCGYGRLHKAPLFMQGGAYGDCGEHEKAVSLPVTEDLAEQTIMIAPRFENECPELVEQYAAAYHKVAANIDELAKYDKEHDFSSELKQLSGRSVALFK